MLRPDEPGYGRGGNKGLGWRLGTDLDEYMCHLLRLPRKSLHRLQAKEAVFLRQVKEAALAGLEK